MTHNSPHARNWQPHGEAAGDSCGDLFGDHPALCAGMAWVPMRVLNQLLDVFGVGERHDPGWCCPGCAGRGWFTTSREGRQTSYALTGRSIRMLDEGRARIFDRGRDAWDGIWRTVIYAVAPRRAAARRDRVPAARLAWHGFRPRWPRPPGSARTRGSRPCGTPWPACPPPGWTCWRAGR